MAMAVVLLWSGLLLAYAAAAPTSLRTGAGAPPGAAVLAIDSAKPLQLS